MSKNTMWLLALVGLYLYYQHSKTMNPQPGDPNFVGPVQQ
jgi:hypothetical protein